MYEILKRMIERKNYKSKEDLAHKIDVFYAVNPPRLNDKEYAELNELLFTDENKIEEVK